MNLGDPFRKEMANLTRAIKDKEVNKAKGNKRESEMPIVVKMEWTTKPYRSEGALLKLNLSKKGVH